MPSGASDKSHELLQDLGIKEVQVQQLRFFCRELYDQSVKTYMHFKLNNKNVIKTAFTGNQKVITDRDFLHRVQLPFFNPNNPTDTSGSESWMNMIDNTKLNSYNTVGDSDRGGLAVGLFGSSTYSSNWNVVGDKPKNPVFECGTSHRQNGENTGNDASKAATLHQVYFKGQAPTDEEVRNRMIANINRLESNK
jgi:hypothetical protein